MHPARHPFLALLVTLSLVAAAQAADPPVKTAVVLSGLNNPCGLAIQPGTGDVFVSDSAALTVVRHIAGKEGSEPVVTGFSKDIYGKGPKYDIGPLGLAFLGQNTLVIGGGGNVDGQEVVFLCPVPPAGQHTTIDKAHKLGPLGPSPQTAMGEGNFYGLAVTDHGIYITSNGDDTKGWVLKIGLQGRTPGKLEPYIATKVATSVDAPVGITTDRMGHLVIGQMGEINVPKDSRLTVYDAESGKLLSNAETGLFDITALAYSPRSSKLYALDFAWMDSKQGGLYRLDVSGEGDNRTVKAVKIIPLDKPTAMAFGQDGALYITEFGTAKEGSADKPGRLLMVTGDL